MSSLRQPAAAETFGVLHVSALRWAGEGVAWMPPGRGMDAARTHAGMRPSGPRARSFHPATVPGAYLSNVERGR